MTHIATFADARRELEAFWPSKITQHVRGLEHIRAFMDFLGDPQDKIKVIHVAGTSGKTSTASYAAALLQAAGKKVGLTVSPHVAELNERVQINLQPLAEAPFCRGLEHFLQLVKQSGVSLTYFELMYTYAYWQFVEQKVDYAVVEVGVGGLLDSTNVIGRPDKVCVITDIGFDHMNLLGNTIREIAEQKAGIIHLRNPVFCYEQDPVIMDVIRRAAQQHQADLHVLHATDTYTADPSLPLFQQRNFGLALAAVEWTLQRDGGRVPSGEVLKIATHTRIPGRMETFKRGGKTIIIDAAHNGQKLEALGQSLDAKYKGKPVVALVSLAAGRDYRLAEAAREMAGLGQHLICTSFGGEIDGPHHSIDPEELAAACRKHGAKSVEIVADPEAALQAVLARPEPVAIVTGSFYLLNHIRPLLIKD